MMDDTIETLKLMLTLFSSATSGFGYQKSMTSAAMGTFLLEWTMMIPSSANAKSVCPFQLYASLNRKKVILNFRPFPIQYMYITLGQNTKK